MSTGEVFTDHQRREIDKAISEADRVSGREFSVHMGGSTTNDTDTNTDSRRAAELLHRTLPRPGNSILVDVDPVARTLEIVTGESVRQTLTDRQVALAALTMQSAFAAGDLAGGLRAGLQQLARLATPVTSLHTDTP